MTLFARYHLPFLPLAFMLLGFHTISAKTVADKNGITDTVYNPFAEDTIRFCGPDSLELNAGANYITYQWNNGHTDQLQKVGATGQYFVTVTNAAAQTFSDTVFVSFIRYDINGYKTRQEVLETNYAVTQGSLQVGRVPDFDGEIQHRYRAGTYWIAPEDGHIDSVAFIVQNYTAEYELWVGIVVLENDIIQLADNNLLLTSPGEKKLPLHFSVKKGKRYKFAFDVWGAGAPSDTDVARLSTGELPGFSCYATGFGNPGCADISNGVWIKLYGQQTSYNPPGNEFFSCHTDSVLIDTRPADDYSFSWSTGAQTPAIKVLPDQSEKYYVDISNDIHSCSDSASLEMFNVPFNPFATDTITVCLQESYTLNAATTGYTSYVWNRRYNDATYRDSALVVTHVNSGWKIVEAESDRGCYGIDSVYLKMNYYIIKSYRFIGDGLYSNEANWEVGGPYNRTGKPPAILGPNEAIYIQPAGVCILDVQQIIPGCSMFVVNNAGKLVIQGDLILQ